MNRAWMIAVLVGGMFGGACLADEASHKKTALELLEAANTRSMIDQVATSVEGMMQQQFAAMNLPPEGKEAADRMQKELMAWFSEFLSWEQMRQLYVDIYMEVFTEAELKELIAFYQSPLGRKMLEKMPELMQKTMQKTQAVLQAKMPAFQERMRQTVAELEAKYPEKKTGAAE